MARSGASGCSWPRFLTTLRALTEIAIWLLIVVLPLSAIVLGPPALVAWAIRHWSRRKYSSHPSPAP
jgi:hypothetical protein